MKILGWKKCDISSHQCTPVRVLVVYTALLICIQLSSSGPLLELMRYFKAPFYQIQVNLRLN